MITVETIEGKPACILFGQPVRGSQQAAWFTEVEVEAARKAKNAKTLACITPVPLELEEAIKGLARGRVEGTQVTLAKAAPDVYAKLLAAAATQKKNEGAQPATAERSPKEAQAAALSTEGQVPAASGLNVSSVTAVGDSWSHLKVGDLVLACYGGPADGWWGARILKIEGDAFTLAWVDETEALARRPRAQLALVHPKML